MVFKWIFRDRWKEKLFYVSWWIIANNYVHFSTFDQTNFEKNNWNECDENGRNLCSEKKWLILLYFFYLFKNSLILIFVFPLIQIWKISRDNIFFLSFIDMFKRAWTRKCFEEEKNSTQFLRIWALFVIYGATVLPSLLPSRYQSA